MHPTVLWAQRDEHIWLTVDVANAEQIKVDLTAKKLSFSCKADGKEYDFEIPFFAPIVESESKYLQHRLIDIVLQKATPEEWPRLTESSSKLSWLKVDWSKWQDSDAEDEQPGAFDMGGMSGMEGMMGGMGGMMGGMEGMMGGMGGMGGMPDFSAFTQGPDSDDEDDDALPELPEDDNEPSQNSSGKLIQEVDSTTSN